MNYILDKMNELGADGVVFHPIGQYPWEKDCKIHCEYDRESILKEVHFPKLNLSYYKVENGKRVWFIKRFNQYFVRDEWHKLVQMIFNISDDIKDIEEAESMLLMAFLSFKK